MFATRRRLQHPACVPWIAADGYITSRSHSDKKRLVPFVGAPFGVTVPIKLKNEHRKLLPEEQSASQASPPTPKSPSGEPHSPPRAPSTTRKVKQEPTLVDLLFPKEMNEQNTEHRPASRTVSLLPLQSVQPERSPIKRLLEDAGELLQWDQERPDIDIPKKVLKLENASPNLVEEDFRRLLPQGKHIEGWASQASDIVKVIPGRDLTNLAPLDFYYILFTSQESADIFLNHIRKIHILAARNMPSSNQSPIPPAPGQIIDGINVHDAIQTYTLVSPSQDLYITPISTPTPPLIEALLRLQGYPGLVDRPSRMPFEARVTFEGPQPPRGALRHFLLKSGTDRSLSWSGGTELGVHVERWKPNTMQSFGSRDLYAETFASRPMQEQRDREQRDRGPVKSRTGVDVYIVGFYTESACNSFVRHWHRRPLDLGAAASGDDAPPIVNAELLW